MRSLRRTRNPGRRYRLCPLWKHTIGHNPPDHAAGREPIGPRPGEGKNPKIGPGRPKRKSPPGEIDSESGFSKSFSWPPLIFPPPGALEYTNSLDRDLESRCRGGVYWPQNRVITNPHDKDKMTDKTIPIRGERLPISFLIQIFMPLFSFLEPVSPKYFFAEP